MARVAALVLATACADTEPVMVGVVLGQEGERAAIIAVEDINAGGGVRGRPLGLRLFSRGYGTGAQVALRIADSLAGDPAVVAVIGHANSSASLAASQVYNARHVTQIAPTSTAPLYSQAGPYSFRLVASDDHQAAFLAREIVARGGGRPALIYVNDDYGRSLRTRVLAGLAAAGVAVVYDAAYVEGTGATGPRELVPALVDARPSVLVWLGRAPDYRRIAPLLRSALPALPVVASDGMGGIEVERDSVGQFAGVHYVRLVDINRPDSALQRVRREYRRSGFGDLSDQAALTYDGVRLAAAAIEAVGPDRQRIRDWLAGLGRDHPALPGITGPLAFVDGGDRAPSLILVPAGAARPAGATP